MPEVIETEVCVIGGGPGGAATSGYLNKKNIPHVLVDSQIFPRNKPCADTISIHVLKYIKDFLPEVHDQIELDAKLHIIKGINVFAPNTKVFSFTYPDLAHFNGKPSQYTIDRNKFDNYLFQGCKNLSSSTVFEDTKILDVVYTEDAVEVISKNKIIKCKLVVMASGCNGSLAPKFNGNKKDSKHFSMGVRAYFSGVKLKSDSFAELILDRKFFLGGFYISPLGNNLYNVNVVMKKGSMKHQKIKLRDHFIDQTNQHPLLKKKFKDAKIQSTIEGHGLMLGTKNRKLSAKRMLFVGDAAGIIDIVTANGIPQAMKSAKIAVEQIEESLKLAKYDAKYLKQYDKRIYKKLKPDLKMGRLFTSIFRTERSYRIALALTNMVIKWKVIDKMFTFTIYGPKIKKD
ncbi:MAG: flavin-dependent dehydrogenase [Saprospiraceae bacterium]|jgi:flavin-dependent dehydrogenase